MNTSTHPRPTEPATGGPLPPPPPGVPAPGVPAPGVPSGTEPGTEPRRASGRVGWAVALIAAGTLWLLHLAGIRIVWELILPIGVIVVGIALLAGGRGVARSGLIGLGVALTAVGVVLSVTPTPISLSVGDRTYAVTESVDLESSYDLGAGTLTLDLRDLELPEGTTELAGSVSMGELVVRVPEGVTVTGTGHMIAGEVDGFGRLSAGVFPRRTFDEAGPDGAPVLDLDLRTGLGRIEVTR